MRRALTMFATAGLTLAMTAACGDNDSSKKATSTTTRVTGPRVSITSPANGTTVQGNVVNLAVTGTGIRIVKADGDTSGTTGHFHVFIDQQPPAAGAVIEKAPGIVHSAENPIVIPGLSIGSHTLTVVLGDGTHTRLGSSQASTTLTVAGPSVDASAPPTVPVNQPFAVTATASGVTIVKADGDTSGKTGHFHVFVDQAPTPAGQPIPTGVATIIHSATSPITVPGLAAGEHTLWVVIGDGTHTPLDPPVMDKVVVVAQ